MILLDTHVLVWLITGQDRVGPRMRETVDAAARSGGVFVPAITPWEIAMLTRKGRFTFGGPVAKLVEDALRLPGVKLAPLTAEIGVDAGELPGDLHGDPADRLIIATARSMRTPVATVDRAILRYAAQGHVQAIDARR